MKRVYLSLGSNLGDRLAELAPELRHPVSRRTIAELLPATIGQAVRKAPIR